MIFKKKETPNCSICKWRSEGKYSYHNGSVNRACEAQGMINIAEAYNNRHCRALYEEERNLADEIMEELKINVRGLK